MLCWENVCLSDQECLQTISILFGKHPDLLFYLFETSRPRLKLSSEILKEYAQVFSSGEELLIRMGLDIWDESGNALFREVHQILDPTNFQNALKTLRYLRKGPKSKMAGMSLQFGQGQKDLEKVEC